MCFEGVAEKWYCGLMTRARPPATFDALRQELLSAFKSVNYEDHLETKLRSRVQGSEESFIDYFHDVMFMCSRIDPGMSERGKIGHLFRGLLPATVRGIYRFMTPDSTTNDLFREAQIFLQGEDITSKRETQPDTVPQTQPVLLLKEEESSTSSSQQETSGVTKDELKQLEKRILENVTKAIEQVNRHGPPHNRNDQGRQPANYRGNKRSRDGRPICNACGKPGHIAQFCGKGNDAGGKDGPSTNPKAEPGPSNSTKN
jgi:hypothetical protein